MCQHTQIFCLFLLCFWWVFGGFLLLLSFLMYPSKNIETESADEKTFAERDQSYNKMKKCQCAGSGFLALLLPFEMWS